MESISHSWLNHLDILASYTHIITLLLEYSVYPSKRNHVALQQTMEHWSALHSRFSSLLKWNTPTIHDVYLKKILSQCFNKQCSFLKKESLLNIPVSPVSLLLVELPVNAEDAPHPLQDDNIVRRSILTSTSSWSLSYPHLHDETTAAQDDAEGGVWVVEPVKQHLRHTNIIIIFITSNYHYHFHM